MVIIGIIGNKQVGKDTFADILCKHYNYKKYSFADPLKRTCKELFDLTDEQLTNPILKETVDKRWNKTPRQILQFIGTDIIRKYVAKDFWITRFENWLLKENSNKIVIPDIRFSNELEAVKNKNAIIIKIERINNNLSDNHISELELNSYNGYDIYINNNFDTKEDYEKFLLELLDTNLLLKWLNK
jgi:dephospho-CoA kinase